MTYYIRFSIFIGSLLISLFFVWYGLRSYGLSQPPSSYSTPLVSQLKEEPPSLWKATQGHSHFFTHLEFRDSQWWRPTPNKSIHQSDPLFFKPLKEAKFSIVMLQLKSPKAIPSLRSLMKDQNIWQKTVFCSPSDGILKDLRALEPEWSFCTGEIFMTRMLALSSLGLASLQRIREDVVFLHLDSVGLNQTFQKLIKEAHRQGKLVFAGPTSHPDSRFNVNGWILQPE